VSARRAVAPAARSIAATAGSSTNPHLRVELAWVPAEFPLPRFACERRRDDGAFAGSGAELAHKVCGYQINLSGKP